MSSDQAATKRAKLSTQRYKLDPKTEQESSSDEDASDCETLDSSDSDDGYGRKEKGSGKESDNDMPSAPSTAADLADLTDRGSMVTGMTVVEGEVMLEMENYPRDAVEKTTLISWKDLLMLEDTIFAELGVGDEFSRCENTDLSTVLVHCNEVIMKIDYEELELDLESRVTMTHQLLWASFGEDYAVGAAHGYPELFEWLLRNDCGCGPVDAFDDDGWPYVQPRLTMSIVKTLCGCYTHIPGKEQLLSLKGCVMQAIEERARFPLYQAELYGRIALLLSEAGWPLKDIHTVVKKPSAPVSFSAPPLPPS